MNKVILIGRVGNQPEYKTFDNGSVCNVSLATNKTWKDKNGEKQTKTEWHRVVAFNKTAELVNNYVGKGSLISIEGELQTRSWETDTGEKRYTTEVRTDRIEFLSTKNTQTNTTDDESLPGINFDSSEELEF